MSKWKEIKETYKDSRRFVRGRANAMDWRMKESRKVEFFMLSLKDEGLLKFPIRVSVFKNKKTGAVEVQYRMGDIAWANIYHAKQWLAERFEDFKFISREDYQILNMLQETIEKEEAK